VGLCLLLQQQAITDAAGVRAAAAAAALIEAEPVGVSGCMEYPESSVQHCVQAAS
jgi:hypothetical protein